MKRARAAMGAACVLAVSACAHTPPVRVNYYLAKSEVTFKVIKTMACDTDNHVFAATSVAPTVKHSAATNNPDDLKSVDFAKLTGALSDTDLKFEFYEDGRLKGVNASSTGQGETIIKSAIKLLGAIPGGDAPVRAPKFKAECDKWKSFNGGKPVTITYEAAVPLDAAINAPQAIKPEAASDFYARELMPAIGGVCAAVVARQTNSGPDSAWGYRPAKYDAKPDEVVIHLRQPGQVTISVTTGPAGGCLSDEIWKGDILAGQHGQPYDLPLPRAAVFGKQTFAISLAESGALNSIQYASNTGAGQALEAASAIAMASQTANAQAAARYKSEADLIAAQERLIQCRAQPASCK